MVRLGLLADGLRFKVDVLDDDLRVPFLHPFPFLPLCFVRQYGRLPGFFGTTFVQGSVQWSKFCMRVQADFGFAAGISL